MGKFSLPIRPPTCACMTCVENAKLNINFIFHFQSNSFQQNNYWGNGSNSAFNSRDMRSASVTNDTYTFPKVRNDLMTAYNGNNCNVSSLSVGESGGFSGNSKVGGCTSGLSFKSVTSGFASVQILPEFPTYESFSRFLEPNVTEDQFLSLLTMYRAHSERMMESINKFHFVEVRNIFFIKNRSSLL